MRFTFLLINYRASACCQRDLDYFCNSVPLSVFRHCRIESKRLHLLSVPAFEGGEQGLRLGPRACGGLALMQVKNM